MLEKVQGRRCETDLVSPTALCHVERLICEAICTVEITTGWCPTNAEAGGNATTVGQIKVVGFDCMSQSFRDPLGLGLTLPRQDDSELFAPNTSNLRCFRDDILKARNDAKDYLVTGGMAKTIIDPFEMINVEHDQCKIFVSETAIHQFDDCGSIEDTGKWIVIRTVFRECQDFCV